ncbi:hypothetical protein [Parachitinimonas caeni]|uniref:Uncharacterized protein n=1 Tax=Parachitinimonas caeni TaxID=3031301 RepID=A0ABT7DXK1_9NEIS|nr:hypothetical protein [Parachitinimonas caeni]MDK2123372.1 hypothetical protein [Parachitinimonas caeni]
MTISHKVAHAVQYIQALELPEFDSANLATASTPLRVAQGEDAGAAVAAGSLVSFVSGLTEQHKNDVLNSTLLAQLAASKAYDRFKQTKLWYDKYVEVLAQVGWVVPAFAFRDYRPSGTSLVLSDAVLEILSAIATGDEMKILRAALTSLREDPKNEGPLHLFDSQSFPDNIGTFQIMPVGEDDGQVVMALAAMDFKSTKHVTRFLWFSWTSSSVKLVQSAQKCVLNEHIYGRVRQQVIDKLAGRASEYIKDIEI